ncbi:MAG: transglutaminase-like domain-containing protein [Oscillospiraceae bacterium]|nr:transglutaminase-like domain-containing protein [Oscillospiraceae bacterium]
MKQQVSATESGIQIENTLSMALQKSNQSRKKGLLLLVAFVGVFSSIFTFLSMFSLAYSLPVLFAAILILFTFFSYCAMKSHGGFLPVLFACLLYCCLFFRHQACISNGLMYLTNAICQTIYMTDWEYFSIDPAYSEIASVTCVLCFLIFPIIWILCFAVLRYHNFFLSLLVTFPFIEIGLFFGIIPNYGFAFSLIAFWFAMMAVQMASSGITHNSKTGFLRRKNAFFPVSSMRFMLPETVGITILCILLVLLLFSKWILHMTGYERPEQIKTWRSDFQNYVASLQLSDKMILENYGEVSQTYDENQEMIELGKLDERIYQDTPVTSISFSDNPHSRMYLKYRTGHVYTGTNWEALTEESYQNSAIFDAFSQIDYYPEEFLYHTAPGLWDMKISLYNATDVLKKCVPYGFQKHDKIACHQDMITTETDTYLITGGADYETLFSDLKFLGTATTESLLENYLTHTMALNDKIFSELAVGHENEKIWIKKDYQYDKSHVKIREAGILCGAGYSDFVYEQETAIPDTQAMQALRSVYADLFTDFNATTATPAETIQKLQEIRNRICQTVSYTLSPGKTPANQDHAAYFLLENRQGYCEHYATAGTVLARMAGIPARYCEGYMIDCSQPGILEKTETDGKVTFHAEILDSNAHAWTEIYLAGIGWIPFEFTFSYFTAPAVTMTDTDTIALPVATETIPVQESESAQSSNLSDTNTEPDLIEDLSTPQKLSHKWIAILTILISAAVSCLILLILRIARFAALRKRTEAFTQEDRKAASQSAYTYLTKLMAECGVHVHSVTIGELIEESETLCSDHMHSAKYSLSISIQLGAKLRYSPHPLSNGELHYLCQTADALALGMYENAKFLRKLYLKWFRHYL